MKYPDFDKAFAPTPEIVGLSIEAAFRKGAKVMKLRHKITAMVSAAAVLAIICAAAVFALPGEPQPDVMAQPKLNSATVAPEETAKTNNAAGYGEESELLPDATLTPRPIPTVMPTAAPVYEDVVSVALEEQIVYHTEKGKYYHYYMNCSGMLYAKPHTISEAKEAGKEACPVCVLGNGVVQQADHMCAIGMEYFLEIFDLGLMDTFHGADMQMQAFGEQTESVLWEEAHYSSSNGLYITIYREMRDDKLMSGNIALTFSESFDHEAFISGSAAWYNNAYARAMETFVSMPANSHINRPTDTLTRIYVYFDSELKPSVCTFDFETDSGFFTLSFDVNGDDVSLASMNYNVSRA